MYPWSVLPDRDKIIHAISILRQALLPSKTFIAIVKGVLMRVDITGIIAIIDSLA